MPVDGVEGDLHAFRRNGENVHRAIVFDVNFNKPDSLDQLLDVLAPGPMSAPIFFGVDLDRLNARRVFADFLARSASVFGHFRQMCMRATRAFFNRLGHQTVRNALELEVELGNR